MSLPETAERLVPHRSAMLLVDRLVHATPEAGHIEARLQADCIVVDDTGCISPLAFVELVAQGVAALKGHAVREAGLPPPVGMLVGVQSFEVLGRACAGELLTIRVRTVGEFGGFTVVDGEVDGATGLVARARIKLFTPPAGEDS